MSLSINAAGPVRVDLSANTPKSREQDAALAAQDSAARTSENAPRAGAHLADLPSPIDRFARPAD